MTDNPAAHATRHAKGLTADELLVPEWRQTIGVPLEVPPDVQLDKSIEVLRVFLNPEDGVTLMALRPVFAQEHNFGVMLASAMQNAAHAIAAENKRHGSSKSMDQVSWELFAGFASACLPESVQAVVQGAFAALDAGKMPIGVLTAEPLPEDEQDDAPVAADGDLAAMRPKGEA